MLAVAVTRLKYFASNITSCRHSLTGLNEVMVTYSLSSWESSSASKEILFYLYT